eukprot:4188529-Alexandrium_andersonii.AAC.1
MLLRQLLPPPPASLATLPDLPLSMTAISRTRCRCLMLLRQLLPPPPALLAPLRPPSETAISRTR